MNHEKTHVVIMNPEESTPGQRRCFSFGRDTTSEKALAQAQALIKVYPGLTGHILVEGKKPATVPLRDYPDNRRKIERMDYSDLIRQPAEVTLDNFETLNYGTFVLDFDSEYGQGFGTFNFEQREVLENIREKYETFRYSPERGQFENPIVHPVRNTDGNLEGVSIGNESKNAYFSKRTFEDLLDGIYREKITDPSLPAKAAKARKIMASLGKGKEVRLVFQKPIIDVPCSQVNIYPQKSLPQPSR